MVRLFRHVPSLEERLRRSAAGNRRMEAEARRMHEEYLAMSDEERARLRERNAYWSARDSLRDDHDIDRGKEGRHGY